MPGDVLAGLGGEENYRAVEIVRLAWALERNTLAEIFHPLFVFVENLVLLGAEPTGSEAVDGDPVRTPVIGEAHCELANAAAACAVRGEARVARDTGDRANVDDAAVVARDHAARYGLRNKKTSTQIGVENQIPVVPGDVEGGFADVASRVVYENVDVAEGFFGGGDHALDAGVIAHVEFEGDGSAAESFDFRFECRKGSAGAAGENEICSGIGKGAGEVLAEAAAGAGDDGDASGEIEVVRGLVHEFVPGVRTTFIKLGSCEYKRSNHRGP